MAIISQMVLEELSILLEVLPYAPLFHKWNSVCLAILSIISTDSVGNELAAVSADSITASVFVSYIDTELRYRFNNLGFTREFPSDGKSVIDKDPIDYAMVRSINEIGQVMGKLTIAKFVESEAILNVLGDIGVNYAQGDAVSNSILITMN